MTKPTKGLYYYFVRIALVIMFFPAIAGLAATQQYQAGTLFTDWLLTAKNLFHVGAFGYMLHETVAYGKGYTEVTTSEYKLFKCRESGKEETFLMFADNEEELERFFEFTRPEKVVFIEPADMQAKSFHMKIYTPEYEDRCRNSQP